MVQIADSFDPSADFDLCEVAPQTWHTIKDNATLHAPRSLGALFPLFTQIESAFHGAMTGSGIPSIILPQEKYALLARIAPEAAVGGVVLMNVFYDRFIAAARSLMPHHPLYYQVIWPLDADIRAAAWHQNTYHEIHLVPGLMCLFQCRELSRAYGPRFHVSDASSFTIEKQNIKLTHPMAQLRDVTLPYAFEHEKDCTCGRPTFRII